jgi:hypothetical protein
MEIDDEYIPGIRGAKMAARLYSATTVIDRSAAWERTLTCGNPDCGETHEYRSDDLLLYED